MSSDFEAVKRSALADMEATPTGMPSEEEIARLLFHVECEPHNAETGYGDIFGWDDAMPAVRNRHRDSARAVLKLLAPILAEKEAEAEQWQNLFESTRASLQQELNRAEARALAAEADAARYQWLRNGNAYAPEEAMVEGGDELDRLCDAAIRAQGE